MTQFWWIMIQYWRNRGLAGNDELVRMELSGVVGECGTPATNKCMRVGSTSECHTSTTLPTRSHSQPCFSNCVRIGIFQAKLSSTTCFWTCLSSADTSVDVIKTSWFCLHSWKLLAATHSFQKLKRHPTFGRTILGLFIRPYDKVQAKWVMLIGGG